MKRLLSILFTTLILFSCKKDLKEEFNISSIKNRGVFSFSKFNEEKKLNYSDFEVEIKNMTDLDITDASGGVVQLKHYPQFGTFLKICLAQKSEVVEYNCIFKEEISYEHPWKPNESRTLSYSLTELGDSFTYNEAMLKNYELTDVELHIAIECRNELLNYNYADIVGVIDLKDDLKSFILNQ